MKKSVRVFMSGTVQGVFFRSFIKEKADRLNVKGYARNLEDGRVEVFAEGNIDNVNAMVEICRRGSPHSYIKKIEVREDKFQSFKEFKILHI